MLCRWELRAIALLYIITFLLSGLVLLRRCGWECCEPRLVFDGDCGSAIIAPTCPPPGPETARGWPWARGVEGGSPPCFQVVHYTHAFN